MEFEGSTSSSLLHGVKAYDQRAWVQLVRLYGPLVYVWCSQAGLQPADAADVGQEVFLVVAQRIIEFHRDRDGGTFRGWLRGITRNRLKQWWRERGKSGRPVGWEEAPTRLRVRVEADGDQALPIQEDAERRMLCARAVDLIRDEFKESDWQAFWRVVVQEQAPRDVAEDLAMSANSVYLAKSRIIRRLRERFADLIEELQ